ncbi:PHD-finger domain-containing protein [Cryptosporidium felis]|nr:PHD-finger domain-containing protein [Cryptosporidium felis]
MLQSSGKLRKSIRVEPNIYQAWVPPFFSEPNDGDELTISSKKGECVYEPSIAKGDYSKATEETLQNLKYLLRNMETDFNCLSCEKLMEYMSKNYISESKDFPEYSEKLLLTRTTDLDGVKMPIKRKLDLDKILSLKKEITYSVNREQPLNMQNIDCTDKLPELLEDEEAKSSNLVTYGKLWDIALNQQLFIDIVDTWRKNVSFIFHEGYNESKYSLEEGIELLEEGIILQKKVKLPEFGILLDAIEKSTRFEEKVKALLLLDLDQRPDSDILKSPRKIPVCEFFELFKEGEECTFKSRYQVFLKSQLEKLKSWRSNVQTAIIEKNLDKCKDSIKDKDEIFIEVPGVSDITEQIAASNWIEKVERSLTRPMKLSLAENLLNEPAAKFLDEKNVVAKQQLINRVQKAQKWLGIVQSPPFVFNLVNACKASVPNDISENTQKIFDEAKKQMEESKDWALPKPGEFEKVWLESYTLKMTIPLMKYMEPIYLRWRKWHKKFKKLMDGMCMYMEAQLILEEAEYTLCDYLDMSEYLPELKKKLNESGDWLRESKEFLKNVSDFQTKQDIDHVSSSIWNTITGIKKGNEFTKLEIQHVIEFMETQFQDRLSYNKLKNLIDIGNELTIYEMAILQELVSCQDSCERWLKKGKELLKGSRNATISTISIINLLLERTCILVSKETESSLFAELQFILWKMDLREIEAPLDDFKLNSLIDKYNEFKLNIDLDSPKFAVIRKSSWNSERKVKTSSIKNEYDENSFQKNEDLIDNIMDNSESIVTPSETNFYPKSPDIKIEELEIHQINISHWQQLKDLEPVKFVNKLQDILNYWSGLFKVYEGEKRSIEVWKNFLEDLRHLPILFNELNSKINKMICDYNRIISILNSGDIELIEKTGREHPYSLLFSYKKLVEINDEIAGLPILIGEWMMWEKHINDLKEFDYLTFSKFNYLQSNPNISQHEVVHNANQVDIDMVNNYLSKSNEELVAKSAWNISDFRTIMIDLNYTGRLIEDLKICQEWIKEIQEESPSNSMQLEDWNTLLQRGKNMNIMDQRVLKQLDSDIKNSIKWIQLNKIVLNSDIFSKSIKQKRNNKSQKKMIFGVAELLVKVEYGIGHRLASFKELKDSVNSYLKLREQGINLLNTCLNERKNCHYSNMFNEYLLKTRVSEQVQSENIDESFTQVLSAMHFTSALREFLEECIRHPILMDLQRYIQDEIRLREINEKMLNALMVRENPYFTKFSSFDSLHISKVSTLKEGNDLINYIVENKLNISMDSGSNLKNIEIIFRTTNNPFLSHKLSLDELYGLITDPNSPLTKEIECNVSIDLINYIDVNLFEQFKKSITKTTEWLEIYKMIDFSFIDNVNTDIFFNKEIPRNILTNTVKSSMDHLLKEYFKNDLVIDSIPQKEYSTQLKFELNWNQIFNIFSKHLNTPRSEESRFMPIIEKLFSAFEDPCNLDLNSNCNDLVSNNLYNNEFSNGYSKYNQSLIINLLHYLRNNKDTITTIQGKEYYDEINSSVKSFLKERYSNYIPEGVTHLERFEDYHLGIDDFSKPKETNKNPDSALNHNQKLKRNKRTKYLASEKINEENIDNLLEIVRNIEVPTVEISLILIYYGRRYIKFELNEINNLCSMVELTLLWMILIVNKFPTIIERNDKFLKSTDNCESETFFGRSPNSEAWESEISFTFLDINTNSPVSTISMKDLINMRNDSQFKSIHNIINLNDFISLIEICDLLPLQIPLKSRLVEILVDALKWSLNAREAILQLPKNTILSPWDHIHGKISEIQYRNEKCKIFDFYEAGKYTNDEDIMRILSCFNVNESDFVSSPEKSFNEIEKLIKKIPRPRGRPKREHPNTKSEPSFEEVFNNICLDYKEIDQMIDGNLPKSFYNWIFDKNTDTDKEFTYEELLSLFKNDELQMNSEQISQESTEVYYGWRNGYFYWNEKDEPKQSSTNVNLNTESQYITLIDPNNYPKKEVYCNKLLIDFILCITIFRGMQNNPAFICAICSSFNNQNCTSSNCSNSKKQWIICDECSRWFHYDCVGYSKSCIPQNKNSNPNSVLIEPSVWICPLCDLRSTDSNAKFTTIVNILKNSTHLKISHEQNTYILSGTKRLNDFNLKRKSPHRDLLKKEIPSQETLMEIMKGSFSNSISFIQIQERSIIANIIYLLNVWIYDFYKMMKLERFANSEFNSSSIIDPIQLEEALIKVGSPLREKSDSSDELLENETESGQIFKQDNVPDISKAMQTSRKGRLLKNKISAKEMLNPKISLLKPKKGRKRRIILPTTATKQIRRNFPFLLARDSNQIMHINFEILFQGFCSESDSIIDLERIGRLKKIKFDSRILEMEDILHIYIIGALIGVTGVIEIEWLYFILKYLIFFNNKFEKYNDYLTKLKNFQIPEEFSLDRNLKQKRLTWDEFKYILVNFSPNFPIKLESYKKFYSNLPKISFNQFQCTSILSQIKNANTEKISSSQIDQTSLTEYERTKINIKNFKAEIESLLGSIVKCGVEIPEEKVMSQFLSIYSLESTLLLYYKQISNVYRNQLSPKPLFSVLVNINRQISLWKELDTKLSKTHDIRLIPPDFNNIVVENESTYLRNQENKPITRMSRFIKCCEAIQDSIEKCNEWSERYRLLSETSNEFEVYVELLKQGLNLPCIFPSVYSFGNILASIESYEDFINQVYDSPGSGNSLVQLTSAMGNNNQPFTQAVSAILGSAQPSINPKFENIQILKNAKEFLANLPIQKNDLIFKIEKMENDTQIFIEGIKQKTLQLKQLGSTEALISQLQLIKEEAIHKVPIIVNNIPELRELLNNIPDFGSPHHSLLLRTQFLMSLQCPIAKLRKPLNPFPNIQEGSPTISNIVEQNQIDEVRSAESKSESSDHTGNVNPNSPKLHTIGSANRFTSSCQFPNNMSLIWQNLVQQGNNPMNHYYYK